MQNAGTLNDSGKPVSKNIQGSKSDSMTSNPKHADAEIQRLIDQLREQRMRLARLELKLDRHAK